MTSQDDWYAKAPAQPAMSPVQAADIGDGQVTTVKLASGAVTTEKVAEGAITEDELDDEAVTTAKLAEGAVTEEKLDDDAVTEAKIADGSVTFAKAAAFVSAEQTANGSEQTIAHGLGVVPAKVLVVPTELPADLAGGYDAAQGVHTDTNVLVTVTTACKYVVMAWA